jgi:hypothetical protein
MESDRQNNDMIVTGLEQANAQQRSENVELRSQLMTAQQDLTRIDEMESDRQNSDMIITGLEQASVKQQSENQELRSQMMHAQQQLSRLDDMESDRQNNDMIVTGLEQANAEQQSENKDLRSQLLSAQQGLKRIDELETDRQNNDMIVTGLEQASVKYQEDNQALRSQLLTTQQGAKRLDARLEEAESDHQNNEMIIAGLEQASVKYQEDNQALRSQLLSAQGEMQCVGELRDSAENNDMLIADLNERCSSLSVEVQTLKSALSKETSLKTEAVSQAALETELLSGFEERSSKTEEELQEVRRINSELQKRVDDQGEELAQLKEERISEHELIADMDSSSVELAGLLRTEKGKVLKLELDLKTTTNQWENANSLVEALSETEESGAIRLRELQTQAAKLRADNAELEEVLGAKEGQIQVDALLLEGLQKRVLKLEGRLPEQTGETTEGGESGADVDALVQASLNGVRTAVTDELRLQKLDQDEKLKQQGIKANEMAKEAQALAQAVESAKTASTRGGLNLRGLLGRKKAQPKPKMRLMRRRLSSFFAVSPATGEMTAIATTPTPTNGAKGAVMPEDAAVKKKK